MTTISLTTSVPAPGALGKVLAKVAGAFAARRALADFAAMSEREYQDIGWGQTDRYSHVLSDETPPERRARALARAAWHRKAA